MALLAICAVPVSNAQSVEAARISGVVQDASGAAVPNAHVSIRNLGTGIADTILTNSDGLIVSPPLAPAEYSVEVEAPGFGPVSQRVRLEVGQHASVTIVLNPGTVTDSVTVESAAPLLGTETATLSNVRDETAVANLPLNGRNFAELMGLTAGVVSAQQQAASVPLTALRGMTSYSVNGLRPEENNYLLDGISDTENHNGAGIVLYPPLDAVQEFREETSVPDARFGRGGGGTVNLVFKSGTGQFHGEAFSFVRNSTLDSRNFFDTSKPAFRMNQFGATLGGPLGRSKQPDTFFFVDYQGTHLAQGLTYISTVPTAAERAGNFAGFLPVFDPTTQVQTASGGYSRSPFPGNTIPAAQIDGVGSKVLNLYPLQNLPGTSNNYLFSPLRTDNGNEFDIKIDHRFSSYDNGFVRYSFGHDSVYQPGSLPAPAVGGGISGLTAQPAQQTVLSENHIFSSTLVNSARFGFSRIASTSTDANAGQALATELGIPGSNVAGNPFTDGLPRITVTGASALGSYGNLPALIVSNNFQYDDSISLTRGRHTIQVGAEVQRRQYNVYQTANLRGTLNFSTIYSANPASTAASGLGLADLLLGRAASGSLQYLDGPRGLRQTELAAFVQDDYRASTKLTINFGIRYENYIGWPWTEVDNRLYVFSSPTGVTQAGTNGIPRSGVYPNNHNFAPRIGAAYQVGAKTVVRAAYGIFFSAPQVPIANDATANPPELVSTAFTNNQYDFPDATPLSQGFSHPATGAVAGSALYLVNPHASLPYTQQWNVTLQHQLTPSTLLSAAYVGTEGTHLLAQNDINQPVPGATAIASRRPFPTFQSIVDSDTIDTSSYNALQVSAERRLARNLSFQLSYTWSHALDYASANPATGGALFEDSYDHRLDRGDADFNLPQRFVGSFVYQLPFRAAGFRRYLVEGWEINGILNLYSGLPFSVQSASNTLNIGTGSRAQYIGPSGGSLPSGERTVQTWFNTAAFTAPPLQQFGDAGRNTLQGPATKQLDFSAFKNFNFHENRQRLQLRAEAFNALNTPQLNTPNATIGAAGAGSITSAGSPFTFQRLSREVQLALKFYF